MKGGYARGLMLAGALPPRCTGRASSSSFSEVDGSTCRYWYVEVPVHRENR